jgi:hypothetical protein
MYCEVFYAQQHNGSCAADRRSVTADGNIPRHTPVPS